MQKEVILKCEFVLLIQICKWKIVEICSRSPRGNVDWNRARNWRMVQYRTVVPHAGTWIEIATMLQSGVQNFVVPHAGTWIEILDSIKKPSISLVVPHAGTWIEIVQANMFWSSSTSFPTRERGLKWIFSLHQAPWLCRSPRGNVDWNWLSLEIRSRVITCRSPRGNVDWNWQWSSEDFVALGRSPRGNVDWNRSWID